MDKILQKHLANAFVLAKSDLNISTPDENIIPYESCVLEENNYNIVTEYDKFTSKIIGYWKDKPIIIHNKMKYAILENSNTIIKLKSLNITDDRIQKESGFHVNSTPIFSSNINLIPKTSKKVVKKVESKLEPIPTEVVVDDDQPVKAQIPDPSVIEKYLKDILPSQEEKPNNSIISSYADKLKKQNTPKEEPAPSIEDYLKSTEPPKEDQPDNSVISSYVDKLKKEDKPKPDPVPEISSVSNYIESGKPKSIEEEIFSLLDSKKDDPRIKRLFSYYSEQTRKEVHEINEKYSKQYFAKILETSGGGGTSNSAVDYSKGGVINGDLTITSNLSVMGDLYAHIDNKRVFVIGNNTDTDYILDHNLDTKDLVISVYDSEDEIVLASVKNINSNQTLISFASPVSNIKVVIMR